MINKIKFVFNTFILCISANIWKRVLCYYQKEPYNYLKLKYPVNLLIIQQGKIGDMVLTNLLIISLKQYFQNSLTLSVLCLEDNKIFCLNNNNIDNVIIYNSKKYLNSYNHKSIFPKNQLAKLKTDFAFLLRGDLKTFYWLMVNKIPYKTILQVPNPLQSNWKSLFNKKFNNKKYIHFVEALDTLDTRIKPSKIIVPNNIVKKNKQRNHKINIYIHISSGNHLRQWPRNNYIKLMCMILKEKNNFIINLIGGKSDYDFAHDINSDNILKPFSNRINNYCDKYSLNQLSKLFLLGDLFIGFDSAPMHIAGLSGMKIVAIMGPQSPDVFGPWGCKQKNIVVYKKYYCSPCWQKSCLKNSGGPGECILAIQPEEVFNYVNVQINDLYV